MSCPSPSHLLFSVATAAMTLGEEIGLPFPLSLFLKVRISQIPYRTNCYLKLPEIFAPSRPWCTVENLAKAVPAAG